MMTHANREPKAYRTAPSGWNASGMVPFKALPSSFKILGFAASDRQRSQLDQTNISPHHTLATPATTYTS